MKFNNLLALGRAFQGFKVVFGNFKKWNILADMLHS